MPPPLAGGLAEARGGLFPTLPHTYTYTCATCVAIDPSTTGYYGRGLSTTPAGARRGRALGYYDGDIVTEGENTRS